MNNFGNDFEAMDDEMDIDFGEDVQEAVEQAQQGEEEGREIDDIRDIFDEDEEESQLSSIDTFLQSKGFKDSKVTVYNEQNEKESIDFHELPEEEQLDILNSLTQKEAGNELSDGEAEWLNELRSNDLDFNSFLELYRESIVQELGGQTEDTYEIDAYDDKELFLLDLQNKYDLTDDELKQELEKELGNEELFTKKVTALRSEYKALEQQEHQMQAAKFEEQKEQEYNTFVNQMVGIAQNVNEFHGLELEDDDKNETLSYMLELDDKGVSQLSKDLNDPQKLYEVAWYLKYGKDAFGIIENAYESEISKLKTQKDKPRVVRQDTQSRDRGIKHMNEL